MKTTEEFFLLFGNMFLKYEIMSKRGRMVGLYQRCLNSLIVLKTTGAFDKNFKTPEPCSPPAHTLGLLHSACGLWKCAFYIIKHIFLRLD